ncbi:preprotein translocase subunit YajC [Clostridium sp. D53t1_180928_C8]|uniref:preprotein translocase subunit YajC n=1 Tax=Clostridium sp. D53t1_180928_C8 TaxID=2787101 RepID=UPI0018AA4050|nr:preprotein translocase subunit YajC [Clostridium sp. D53t1_180928_C8]
MDTKNIVLLALIIIGICYVIIAPFIRYKGVKDNNEKHLKFLNNLKSGDKVVLSSGILGVLKEKTEESYSIEISERIIIKVLPASIIGRS